jgi:hypothetical protein
VPVRHRVIARHISGESKRVIAIEEGIDRATVSRILSQREVVQMIAQYQARLLELMPDAIDAIKAALRSDDHRLRTATALKMLEGFQVLHGGGIEQTIAVANMADADLERKDQQALILGHAVQMMLEKGRRYDLPVPSELERLEAETRDAR